MYFGLAMFATLSGLYWTWLPKLRNIEAVDSGGAPPYAGMDADIIASIKDLFMVQLFFWATLWAVKLSLLCMYRKLTVGLLTYTRVWWGVVTFTILTFLGCLIGEWTACSSLQAWFEPTSKQLS